MTTMNSQESGTSSYTSFWPVCLMAISLGLFLGWQVMAGVLQHNTLLRMSGQQTVLVQQASETESKLQSLIMDLLKLARTDADAKAIVTKYRINLNSASQPVLLTGESPAPTKPAVTPPAPGGPEKPAKAPATKPAQPE